MEIQEKPQKPNRIDKAIDTAAQKVKDVADEIKTSKYINPTPRTPMGRLFKVLIIGFLIMAFLAFLADLFGA